jgi:DNA-binding transcriptional LysR family regulator
MQQPELRLIRYWVAVAEEANITRAAERLHLSQPALSVAIKQLEGQLGVALLERGGRGVTVTAAGIVLMERGRELLAVADALVEEVRARDEAAVGRLRIGMAPTARYGVGPALLAAASDGVPGVMLYPQEDTTGALLRDVRNGRLDLAVLFCATGLDGVASRVLAEERAVVHVRADHPVAGRSSVALEELKSETFLVAESTESGGFTARVLEMCRARGFEPATRPDPYPDLGLQAVREGLGVVLYVRGAFPPELPGSAFVPVEPAVTFPFTLAWREGTRSGPVAAVLAAVSG